MQAHVSTPARVVATLILLFLCLAPESADAADAGAMTYDDAVEMLKSGKDNLGAVKQLEEVAAEGSLPACFMLGAVYWNGKYVPQNRPLALAYLQITAQAKATIEKPIVEKAAEWVRTLQAQMEGSELIKADQLAAQISANQSARIAAYLAPAVRAFTPEAPVAFSPVIRFAGEPVQLLAPPVDDDPARDRSGCAARKQPDCPRESAATDGERCVGSIVAADSGPSTAESAGAIIEVPAYPIVAAFADDNGVVKLMAHVDRSGWVCRVVVAKSSGTPAIDVSALSAASRWKLRPAMKDGAPIEALFAFSVSFRANAR